MINLVIYLKIMVFFYQLEEEVDPDKILFDTDQIQHFQILTTNKLNIVKNNSNL